MKSKYKHNKIWWTWYIRDTDYQWFKLERNFTNCINAENYQGAAQVFEGLMDNEYISNAPSLQLASCRLFGLLNSMINALGEVRLTMDADFLPSLTHGDNY